MLTAHNIQHSIGQTLAACLDKTCAQGRDFALQLVLDLLVVRGRIEYVVGLSMFHNQVLW
jgi:hypothetical protein